MKNIEKKQENTSDASNKVFRKDICMGIASLIKIVDKKEILVPNHVVLDESQNKKMVAIDIRKMVFENHDYIIGEDLFYRLNRNGGYQYRLIDSMNNNVENNTIVIRNDQSLNEFLKYVGFSDVVKSSDLRDLKKLLLSKGSSINIQSHTATLTKEGIVNEDMIRDVNKQAAELLSFRKRIISDKPQQIEKVYTKYFK